MSKEQGKQELRMNPQKKRLEQLKIRREQQEEKERQQLQLAANSKSKKKASREAVEMADNSKETDVKMSAESVDLEYSVEEDYEDEEYKNTKNEQIKNLLIEEKRLKKAIRLTVENEKKLSAVLEEFTKRFDEMDKCLDSMLVQIDKYKDKSGVTYSNMLRNQLPPLIVRWKSAQETMRSLTISIPGQIYTGTVFGNLAHYGIFILRKVLYTMAYVRDMVPQRVVPPPLVAAPVTVPPAAVMDKTPPLNSPKKKEEDLGERNVSMD